MPYQPYPSSNPYQRRQPALQGLADFGMTPVEQLTQQDAAEMLQEGPMQANNAVALAGLRDQRKRELEQSLTSGAADPYQATQMNRLGALNRDIAADPFTGTAEQGRVTALQDLLRGTQLQGFDSPQAAAQYGRAQEERKVGMPLDVARTTGELDIEQEKERQRGMLEVAKEHMAPQRIRLAQGPTPGVTRESYSRGGFSTSYAPEQAVPSALINQLDRARQLVATSSRNQPVLDQAIASVMASHPTSQDVKNLAATIMNTPDDANAPFTEILRSYPMLTPPEQADLAELLSYIRGSAF